MSLRPTDTGHGVVTAHPDHRPARHTTEVVR